MGDDQPDSPVFSFIVPVYNEREGLENFYARLTASADELAEPYEIVFINDGSSDGTDEILRGMAERDERVRVVAFSRNFGHQVAVTAGYDHAAGRAVISLDSDCQHPPEMIPDIVQRWRDGFEVVCTVRKDTAGISRLRRMVGRGVYRVIRAVSGAELTDQADFRLLDRKVVDALKEHREHARFVRGLVRWVGFRRTELPYVAERRAAGSSSYTLKQLAGMAGAGVFNFSLRPLRAVAVLGGVFLGVALLYALVSLVLWGFGLGAGAMMHLVMFIVAMFGVQFLVLGVLGEYVGRTFDEVKGRPLYVVRERIGFPEEGAADQIAPEGKPEQQAQGFSVFT